MKLSDLKVELTNRGFVSVCQCVCHVGVNGFWRAHSCGCDTCPSKRK